MQHNTKYNKIQKQKRIENSMDLETFLHTSRSKLFLNSIKQELGLCQVFLACIYSLP